MIISNARIGFAVNSSSTHSIIINKNHLPDNYTPGEFGWEEFILSSKEAKGEYFAQTLLITLMNKHNLDFNMASIIVKNLMPDVRLTSDGNVDHQSFLSLPLDRKTRQVSIQFFNELVKYYSDPKFAIVGGNDNDGQIRFPPEIRKDFVIPQDSYKDLICRKDNGRWTLQNTLTGTKIRLSFNDNAKPYTKATKPELVDLKITDMCHQNCKYCYQNSTPNGKHASQSNIYKIISLFEQLEVMEVVLGGGEPTLHPDFAETLFALNSTGVLTTFTTRDLSWVKNDKILTTVNEYVSKIAISINSGMDIRKYLGAINSPGTPDIRNLDQLPDEIRNKVYFQYVIGTGDLQDILKTLKKYPGNHVLILLGYKNIGRGKNFIPNTNENNWFEMIKKEYGSFGVDALLAKQLRESKESIPKILLSDEEGKFSMYIDAVEMKMGKSSYCEDYTSIIGKSKSEILEQFVKY